MFHVASGPKLTLDSLQLETGKCHCAAYRMPTSSDLSILSLNKVGLMK